MTADRHDIREQVSKRLTLNLLIQGAAAHTCLTAHHLVKDELAELHTALPGLYDRLSVSLLLNYFIGDIPLLFGMPTRFWNRVDGAKSPFREHPLLIQHGRELWQASKRQLLARGWKKRIIGVPVLHYLQAIPLVLRVARAEHGHRTELSRLAERTTSMIWNIDEDQLDGQLTHRVAFGKLRPPKTYRGAMVKGGAVGYAGVEYRAGRLVVVGKALFWPLLLHELVKGTAELVCLHGLNTLDDETYSSVLNVADHIEYETWMLQAGPELWRRFLAALPPDREVAEVLMHVARLEPRPFEDLMFAVVRGSTDARTQLHRLAR